MILDNSIVKHEIDHFDDNAQDLNDWDAMLSTEYGDSQNDDDDDHNDLFIKKEDDLDIDTDPVPLSPQRPSLNQKSRFHQSIKKAKSSFRSHSKSKNPNNMKCSRCEQTFRQYSELKAHLHLHSKSDQNGNQFDCPLCKYPCFSER